MNASSAMLHHVPMTFSADGAAANAELTARAAEQADKMSLLMPISGKVMSNP